MSVRRGRLAKVCAMAALLCGAATAADAGEWEWGITPYFWASSIQLDATFDGMDVGGTVPFGDLIDKLDMGALVHFEGRTGRTGFYVNATYFSLSDSQTTDAFPVSPTSTQTRTEMDQLLLESGGLYSLVAGDRSLDLLFGLRLLDLSIDSEVDFPDVAPLPDTSRSMDRSFLDGFVGLRYRAESRERFLWNARIDAGSGDSDLTWQAAIHLGWKVGKSRKNTLLVGYRHTAYELDEGTTGFVVDEVAFSGMVAGFRFGI